MEKKQEVVEGSGKGKSGGGQTKKSFRIALVSLFTVGLRLGHTSCLEKETKRGAPFSFRSNCTANFFLDSSYRQILTALGHSISPNIDNFVSNLFIHINILNSRCVMLFQLSFFNFVSSFQIKNLLFGSFYFINKNSSRIL